MLEKLDYLIRTLTYKRSSLECSLRDLEKVRDSAPYNYLQGQIDGLSTAINELYKMLNEMEE